MNDLAINGGDVVLPGITAKRNVGIQNGTIVEVSSSPMSARQEIDASGMLVIPGVIDSHTHFRSPAYPEKEDFVSGTSAAASGGVTTILEMPMADIATATEQRFVDRRDLLTQSAVIDFGLIAGASLGTVDEIPGLRKVGAVAFKSFLREPYPGREANFRDNCVTDDRALLNVAHAVAAVGLPWSVHAENHDFVDAFEEDLFEPLPQGSSHEALTRRYLDSRPVIVETEPIMKVALVAENTGVQVHVVHVTSRAALDIIADFQRRGVAITGEACLPHLMLNVDDVLGDLVEFGRMSPRVRLESDRQALWHGLLSRTVETISSDHASFSKQDVSIGWGDTGQSSAGGIAGTEHLLLLVLRAAAELNIPLEVVIRALTEAPAKLFGLWPKKGSLLPGFDADIAVLRPDASASIRGDDMYSKAKWTIFDGWNVPYAVDTTVSRGRIVYSDGTLVGEPGMGQFVPRINV